MFISRGSAICSLQFSSHRSIRNRSAEVLPRNDTGRIVETSPACARFGTTESEVSTRGVLRDDCTHPTATLVKGHIVQPMTENGGSSEKQDSLKAKGALSVEELSTDRSRIELFRRWTKKWKAVLGLFIPGLLNAALLFVVIFQSRIYRRQADLMRDQLAQMQLQTEAGIKAANASEEASKLAKQTAVLDQRAWITAISLDGKPRPGEGFYRYIHPKNKGKTFATDVQVYLGIRITRDQLAGLADVTPKEWQAVDASKPITKEPFLIAPGEEGKVPASYTGSSMGSREWASILGDPFTLIHVSVKVTYQDVFECKHWTEFGMTLAPYRPDASYYQTSVRTDDNQCR